MSKFLKVMAPAAVFAILLMSSIQAFSSDFTRVNDLNVTNSGLGKEVWQVGKLLFGDAVKDSGDTVLKMSYEEAKAYCESKYARLPTRNDWLRLRNSSGAESNVSDTEITSNYHPTLLPSLRYYFWTDSEEGATADTAFFFSGIRGNIAVAKRTVSFAVRCVRDAK